MHHLFPSLLSIFSFHSPSLTIVAKGTKDVKRNLTDGFDRGIDDMVSGCFHHGQNLQLNGFELKACCWQIASAQNESKELCRRLHMFEAAASTRVKADSQSFDKTLFVQQEAQMIPLMNFIQLWECHSQYYSLKQVDGVEVK
ncbi:hypothetical protein Tco_0102842 [Tanacetum coccineum]